MKLASGACRVADLAAAGVTVALGTDSTASNNRLDMFEEMRLAALLGKHTTKNAAAVSAYEAVKMATVNGAKALRTHAHTGSLQVGKQADFIAIEYVVFACVCTLYLCCLWFHFLQTACFYSCYCLFLFVLLLASQ
jgi:5-methylthioadenosine/S-adenosylhomocysteine deaminase